MQLFIKYTQEEEKKQIFHTGLMDNFDLDITYCTR